MKPGFYTVELVSTTWEVPERYLNLSPVGSGAFGQVIIIKVIKVMSKIMITYDRYVQRQTRRREARMGEM